MIRRSVIHNDHTRSAENNDDQEQINEVESSTRTYTRRTGSSFPRGNVVSPNSQHSSNVAAARSAQSRPKSSRYSTSAKPVEVQENKNNDDQDEQSISPSPSLSSEDLRQDENDSQCCCFFSN